MNKAVPMSKAVLVLLLAVYAVLGAWFAADGRTGLAAGCAGMTAVAAASYWLHRRTARPTVPVTLSADQEDTVRALMREGRQVAAVRYVRRQTGAGLIAAAKAIDAVTQPAR
jgi:hypothetical protein